MPGADWDRVKQIFHEVLEKDGPERESLLHALCGDDAELRSNVETLLAAHAESGEFLESPTVEGASEAARAAEELAKQEPPEGPGSRIGNYKLLQLIGEGGFGAVYMAEQQEPIRRRVALKIIKPGMDSKQVIARFEAERQALAMLDHPNIARVFDAGTTETGRPFFVMELVRGVEITEFCDKNRLSTRERLKLFREVCRAMHHAHQAGIIHRDIKPSNVLVTMHDAEAMPKVIDFGVAKATHHRLTEKTLFTEYGQFIGTPTYMSPEQAELGALEVDARSDIYSLGVLLYELLTGSTPFDSKALRSAAYLELLRIIREEEPPRPSTRLSTLGNAVYDVAKKRGADASALTKLLSGDLDWIAMKALEKSPRRRYDSAADLAEDIDRYFDQDPILARPPSAAYRLQKFVAKRRVPLAAAATIAAAFIGAGSYTAWQTGSAAMQLGEGNLESSDLTLRRVWSADELDVEGQVSRDGRYIPFEDEKTGDLSVRDLTTGENRRVTQNRDPLQSVQHAHLSEDNRRIAYSWGMGGNVSELRVIGFDGAGERTLGRLAGVSHISVDGWSADGEHILAGVSREDGTFQIAWVSTEDGSLSVLKTLNRTQGRPHMHLSRDRRWIAYDFLSEESGRDEDIALLAADGSREITVVSHPSDDDLVAWVPDGSGLLFRSNRSGGDALWLLELGPDGNPSSEPTLVKDHVEEIRGRGFSDSGALFYTVEAVDLEDLYLARLDPGTGRVVGTPSRATTMVEDATRFPDWSPDGTRLAYALKPGAQGYTFVIRDLASGNERFLSTDLRWPSGRSVLRWAPDGGSLAFLGHSPDRGDGVYRIDVETGEATLIVAVPEELVLGGPVWAPDGGAMFYATAEPATREVRVVRLDLATGEETQLYSSIGPPWINRSIGPPWITGRITISPDGQYLGTLYPMSRQNPRPTQLMVLPTRGGELREVYHVPEGEHMVSGLLDWTPQGDLIFGTHRHEDAVGDPMTELWRIRLDGEDRESLGLEVMETNEISVHPDGTWIALVLDYEVDELWAIENLLSTLPRPN